MTRARGLWTISSSVAKLYYKVLVITRLQQRLQTTTVSETFPDGQDSGSLCAGSMPAACDLGAGRAEMAGRVPGVGGDRPALRQNCRTIYGLRRYDFWTEQNGYLRW